MKRNIRGQGMIEYILIVALVVVAGIGVWKAFGKSIRDLVKSSRAAVTDADAAVKSGRTDSE